MTGVLIFLGLWLAAAVVVLVSNDALHPDDEPADTFDQHAAEALSVTAHDPRCHCPGCCQALYSLPSPTTEHKP